METAGIGGSPFWETDGVDLLVSKQAELFSWDISVWCSRSYLSDCKLSNNVWHLLYQISFSGSVRLGIFNCSSVCSMSSQELLFLGDSLAEKY